MLKSIRLSVVAIALLATSVSTAQKEVTPGLIKLLLGYRHERLQGIDSLVGKIWKDRGVDIRYDIGELAGNYAECKSCEWTKGEVWRKKQIVNGQQVILVFTSSKRFLVVFPQSKANFYATISKEEDMADMLLMLLTFQKSFSAGP